MSALTEEVPRGDWFYLEEDEAFDPQRTKVYSLADGEVRSDGRIVGAYSPGGICAELDMEPTGDERRWTITLRAPAGHEADATSPWLQADSALEFAGQEPWSTIGSFRRKTVNYVKPSAIRRLGAMKL